MAKLSLFDRRRRRVRTALKARAGGKPRLSVHRTGKHIYAQAVDDSAGKTLVFLSTLDADGAPGVVQRTLVAPPRSRLGPVTPKERAIIQSISPFDGKYDTAVNRESAAEVLAQKSADAAAAAQQVIARPAKHPILVIVRVRVARITERRVGWMDKADVRRAKAGRGSGVYVVVTIAPIDRVIALGANDRVISRPAN